MVALAYTQGFEVNFGCCRPPSLSTPLFSFVMQKIAKRGASVGAHRSLVVRPTRASFSSHAAESWQKVMGRSFAIHVEGLRKM